MYRYSFTVITHNILSIPTICIVRWVCGGHNMEKKGRGLNPYEVQGG